MSHTRAVISELLVTPGDGTSVYVPTRIRRQLAAATRTKLLQLIDQTEDVVLDAVAEDALLGQWEALSPAARTLVVAILEIPVFSSVSPNQTTSPAPDWICARAEISDSILVKRNIGFALSLNQLQICSIEELQICNVKDCGPLVTNENTWLMLLFLLNLPLL